MLSFGAPRRRRRIGLTPMIDVVFLLLVFFMLASRFGIDRHVLLNVAGLGGTAYSGPPRLIDVLPDGLRLNGVPVAPERLTDDIAGLTETPQDTIVLRPRGGASLQRVIAVMDRLRAAGFNRVVLVE